MRFGIHVPKQGNLTKTAVYARDAGCRTMQIFSGNPIGWRVGALDPADRDGFREVVSAAEIDPVLVHAPYLINLAARERRLRDLSRRALLDALERASALGGWPVVVHAGNHKGAGAERGVERAIRTLDWVLDRAPAETPLLIENGSGRGTEIGSTPEELGRIVAPLPARRVGILLDTAHLWAQGYDIRKDAGVARLVADVRKAPGLRRLRALHANDSLAELGSHRDLHAFWGDGQIGRAGLRTIVRSAPLARLAVIFEVPAGDLDADRRHLIWARKLDRQARRP